MTDREALLAAIRARPEEDTPRLAYADLVQEGGNESHATYIREAIEYDQWYDPHEQAPRAIDARMRLAALMSQWFPEHWPIPPLLSIAPKDRYLFLKDSLGAVVHGSPEKPGHRATFSRGFCLLLVVRAQEWDQYGDVILSHHPVEDVIFTSWPSTDVSDVMDAESVAMASREIVGAVILGKLAKRWPGINFKLPDFGRRMVTG